MLKYGNRCSCADNLYNEAKNSWISNNTSWFKCYIAIKIYFDTKGIPLNITSLFQSEYSLIEKL